MGRRIGKTLAVALATAGLMLGMGAPAMAAPTPAPAQSAARSCSYWDSPGYPDPLRTVVKTAKASTHKRGKRGETTWRYVQRVYRTSVGLDHLTPAKVKRQVGSAQLPRKYASCGDLVLVKGRWGIVVTPRTYATITRTGGRPVVKTLPSKGARYYTINR